MGSGNYNGYISNFPQSLTIEAYENH